MFFPFVPLYIAELRAPPRTHPGAPPLARALPGPRWRRDGSGKDGSERRSDGEYTLSRHVTLTMCTHS